MLLFQSFAPNSRSGFLTAGLHLVLGLLVSGSGSTVALAQTVKSTPATEQSTTQYVSAIDDALTIRKVSVLPVTDNLDGIYARPIESNLITLAKSNHQWDYVDANLSGPMTNVNDLETNPAQMQKLTSAIEADAFITATASKGPGGISIKLDLYLKNDSKLFAQEILKDHPRFELTDLKEQVQILYRKLIGKVPYEGFVLSRQLNRVTLSLGKSDGISKDQMLTAIQIVKVTRHPKFNFLISTEKEFLGKIKILKVDDSLSFGTIVSEREKGAIKKLSKISGIDSVTYSVPDTYTDGAGQGTGLSERADNKITFGENPTEWLPVRPPSFGQVGLKLGLGNYTGNLNLVQSGSLTGSAAVFPSLGLFGELWLDPNWTIRADILQGVFSTTNPLAGSSPGTLNYALSRYSLQAGYSFLLRNDFFGPKLQVRGGYMTSRLYVDDSTPRGLTTTTYSGMLLGLSGSLPVTEQKLWFVGATLNMILFPSLSEAPTSSGGSPSNTINDFSIFAERKISENIHATGSLDFSLYSTNFSAGGSRGADYATSMSQKYAMLTGGIAYLF
jgi:hypothetical protein